MLSQAQNEFISLLSKVDYSKRLYDVFHDFCTLGTYSLALPFYPDLARDEFERVSNPAEIKTQKGDQMNLF
jgi:hypothetical protein